MARRRSIGCLGRVEARLIRIMSVSGPSLGRWLLLMVVRFCCSVQGVAALLRSSKVGGLSVVGGSGRLWLVGDSMEVTIADCSGRFRHWSVPILSSFSFFTYHLDFRCSFLLSIRKKICHSLSKQFFNVTKKYLCRQASSHGLA